MVAAWVLALLYAPLSLAFNLFVIATAPLWALMAATFRVAALPWPLSLVHTHDNPVYGGPTPATFASRFRAAVWWLVRNPGYGLDAYLLGYAHEEVSAIGTRQSGSFGGQKLAWAFSTLELTGNRKRFLLRADIPLLAGRYAKFWIGWHIINQAGRHMFKIDFNPFKTVRLCRASNGKDAGGDTW